MARTFWTPRRSSSQASERSPLRLRSRQATWTITSWPRARNTSASSVGRAMACPPALSVIEIAATRGSSTRAWAAARPARPALSATGPRHGTSSVTVTNSSVVARRSRRPVLLGLMRGSPGPRRRLEPAAVHEQLEEVGLRLELHVLDLLDPRPEAGARRPREEQRLRPTDGGVPVAHDPFEPDRRQE